MLHLVQEGARHLARRERPPSLQEVARALGDLRPAHTVEAGLDEPAAPMRNVRVIVLESFWDVSLLTGASLSEDPMDPRFRLLWKAGGYSHALSPVFGGYTANAEFEALCGFPVSDDAVFFEMRLRRDAPCLPRHLAESGYVTLASHPNVAAFWNRVNAYRRVGFQTYWSQNDFDLDDMNREMLSDASLYRQVLARIRPLLEAGTPLFNYILTFSGHLDYPLGPARPPVLTAGSAEPLVAPYANNLYYKSRELTEFLAALHDADPDGIVIVFGDHLPPLGYEYAAYVESGLLAPEPSGFTDAMFRTLVATPLLILDGQNGLVAVGDLPMYRLPTVILGLLGDRRPSLLTLAATVPEPTVRPLPGTNLILVDGEPHACCAGLDDHPACTQAAEAKMPKTPAAIRADTNAMRHSRKPDSIASRGGRGGRRMVSGSVASKASAIASATELTMLTHRIWTRVIGSVRPNSTAIMMLMASPPLIGSRNTIAFLRLS